MDRDIRPRASRARGVALAAGLALTHAGCGAVVDAGSYTVEACAGNADCIDAHGGAAWVCRKSDHTCQALVTDDCQTVLGADNLRDDGNVLWGAIFALNGANSSTGRAEFDALKMAYGDFAVGAEGLPPLAVGGKRRQLSVLVCDDSAANDVALRSVTHMVEDVGIAAIVGPNWSGPTINFLTKETLPHQVLVVASGTTSPDLTTLDKNGLFFRTCESTSLEVPALVALVSDVEAKLAPQQPTGQAIKLALAYKGDSFGKGTVQVLLPKLTINGAPATDTSNDANFAQFDYGNPGDPTTDPLKYTDTVTKIVALRPNIVLTVGTTEMFGNIMQLVEQQWPSGVRKPFWVYPHTGVSPALSQLLQQNDPTGDLRRRILGVVYGSRSPNYQQFRANFVAQQFGDGASPDQFDLNTTYDAFYSLAYAATSIGAQPLTGPNLGAGFANLVPPAGKTSIDVGPQDINQALSLLSQGQQVNLVGTSGPLDFNLTTGDVTQENQVFCIPVDKNGAATLGVFSGYGFDLNNKRTGSIDAVTATCGVTFTP